jgi:hypothetical protein
LAARLNYLSWLQDRTNPARSRRSHVTGAHPDSSDPSIRLPREARQLASELIARLNAELNDVDRVRSTADHDYVERADASDGSRRQERRAFLQRLLGATTVASWSANLLADGSAPERWEDRLLQSRDPWIAYNLACLCTRLIDRKDLRPWGQLLVDRAPADVALIYLARAAPSAPHRAQMWLDPALRPLHTGATKQRFEAVAGLQPEPTSSKSDTSGPSGSSTSPAHGHKETDS